MHRAPAARSLFIAALLGAALLLSGCGGDAPAPASADAALEHIHGLGVDPANDGLVIATHRGLFTAPEGETEPRRVGDSDQDTMGFSVVGPRHYIGSGHPGSDDSLPPNLGLIESRDGGQSWRSVSLLGEVDFHALQAAERMVYGFDATRGRLMVSGDTGRDWEERPVPASVFGLAIDPADPARVVAGTQAGIYISADAARSWRALREDTTGLLAWPAPRRLFLVDGEGQVHLSADAGANWRRAGRIGGSPAAFAAAGDELHVALRDGTVKRSRDDGRSWAVRTTA